MAHTASITRGRVGVRGVDSQHIHLACRQLLRALQKIARGPIAAPTRSSPCGSLAALGYFNFF